MPTDSPVERMQRALESDRPSVALQELARALRDEGMSRADLLRLYDDFWAHHELDPDETRYEAVLDAMDLIEGWSSPDSELYPGR